jgi:hypothetical protein
MNGTMGKPFDAGRAAISGVVAARGYTVNDGAIEAEQGLASTASTSLRPEVIADEMGDRSGVDAVLPKVYACGGGSHPTIDAIARLQRAHPFTATDVESMRLDVSPLVASICIIDAPFTGVVGKFSLRYCAALSLLGRPTGPSSFTDHAMRDPFVLAVLERVRTQPLDREGPVVDVEIRLCDGRVVSARPGPTEPLDAARVPRNAHADVAQHGAAPRAKFFVLTTPSSVLRRPSDWPTISRNSRRSRQYGDSNPCSDTDPQKETDREPSDACGPRRVNRSQGGRDGRLRRRVPVERGVLDRRHRRGYGA